MLVSENAEIVPVKKIALEIGDIIPHKKFAVNIAEWPFNFSFIPLLLFRDNIESRFLCVGIVLYDADRCFGRRFFGSYYYHDIGCIYPERAYDRQEGCGCIYGAFGSFNAYFERSGYCFGRAFGWPGYGRLVLFGR